MVMCRCLAVEASGGRAWNQGDEAAVTAAHEWGVGAWADVVAVVTGWKARSGMQSEAGRLFSTHGALMSRSIL